MAVYSTTAVTTLFTTASAGAELIAGSTDRVKLLEIGWGIAATPGAAFTLKLGRPAATGITPSAPVTLTAEDSAEPVGTTTLETTGWGTAPTVPANFFRNGRLFHASEVIYEFPAGLTIATTKSVVLWNIGTGSAAQLYVSVDE